MNENIYQKYILDSPESQDSLNDFSSIYYENNNYLNQPNYQNFKNKEFTKNSFQEISYQNYQNNSISENCYCEEKIINDLPKTIENNSDYWDCNNAWDYNNTNKCPQKNTNHRIPLPDELPENINHYDKKTFISKRNERERDRVRNLNDKFERLKKHLSKHNEFKKDKRLSKVQTLKLAISYIKKLENDLKPKIV